MPRDLEERYSLWERQRLKGLVCLERGSRYMALRNEDVRWMLWDKTSWQIVPQGLERVQLDGSERLLVDVWWRSDVRWRVSQMVNSIVRDVLETAGSELDVVSELAEVVAAVVMSWVLAEPWVGTELDKRYPDEFLIFALRRLEDGGAQAKMVREALAGPGMDVLIASMVNVLMVVMQRRTYWELVAADPQAGSKVVREALRLYAPFLGVERVASAGMRLGGQDIEVGTRVVLNVAAALRDSSSFVDPDSFRMERSWHSSLKGYQQGGLPWLSCRLGWEMALAALLALTRECPNMRLAKDNDWLPREKPWTNSLQSLRIRLR